MNREASPRIRWSGSFIAATLVHVLLVVLLTWQYSHHPLPKPKLPQFMDVTLLKPQPHKTIRPPKKADAISNLNAKGSSTTAKDRQTRLARSPVIGQHRQRPLPARPQIKSSSPSKAKQKKAPRTALAKQGRHPVQRPKKIIKKIARKHQKINLPPVPLTNFMPSSMALAELSRNLDRERRLKTMLSREADIPINTRKAKFAPYARQLVRALEEQWRPGDANYAQYADDARQALMRITIDSSGELSHVEILRPSPIASVNDSAVRAIHAAAPFRPLPSSWGLDRVSFYLTFEVIDNQFVFHAR